MSSPPIRPRVPVDLNKCRVASCTFKPEWRCEWNLTGKEYGVTMAFCNTHKRDKETMASNWRVAYKDPVKEFWEEFNS